MKTFKVNCFTKSLNLYNEDAYLIRGNFILCMDGATGLNNQRYNPSDACFLIQKFIENFDENADFISEINRLSEDLYKKYFVSDSKDRSLFPSMGIGCVRLSEDKLDVYILGDIEVFIRFKDGQTKLFKDETLSKLDGRVISKMKDISLKESINVIDTKKYVLDDLISNRNLMNLEKGYRVFSVYENPKLSPLHYSLNSNDILDIYLASDGYVQAYDTFKIVSSREELYLENKPECLYENVLKTANLDSGCNLYPRFKLIDDATLIKVEIINQ